MTSDRCQFCDASRSHVLHEGNLVKAIFDGFPVSPGHALIITRRHVPTWFDASREEQNEMLETIQQVQRILDDQFAPAGFNIGWNVGAAAGQTIFHLHLHVIPRYVGDVTDPTGGIRNVIPGKGKYRGE